MERIGVGGGDKRGERVFAEVINTLITMYIYQTIAVRCMTLPFGAGTGGLGGEHPCPVDR